VTMSMNVIDCMGRKSSKTSITSQL